MRTDTALRPIHRILVGGPPAGGPGAAEVGIRLAKLLDARLRVVHVQTPHPLLERLGLDSKLVSPLRSTLTDADVIHLAHREGLRPATYETETLRGQPRQVLVDEIRRWQADLLVVGAHERNLPGVRLGTVAEHLIRNATCPVLIVNGRRPIPPRRVLFPVDLSEFALYAVACGLNFLEQINADQDKPSAREALLVVPPNGESRDERQRAGREGLGSWLEKASFEAAMEQSTAEGSPAPTIVDQALRGEFDLVIMGTHGHGSHGPPLGGIGSVTGEVLDRAPCHMLIVPPQAEFGAELADAVVSQTEPSFTSRLFL